MKSSCRDKISGYGLARLNQAAEHPGLWFDRYLGEQPEKSHSDTLAPYGELAAQCSKMRDPAFYRAAYERWLAALQELGMQPVVMKTTYRLAAGHGGESVIETGISLHHTYGVPYIPGSSLKGVARSYAEKTLVNWGPKSWAHKELFGSQELAGCVTFYDALPRPDTWRLLPDTITVHHRDYYQGSRPPGDWDDPTPIPFLSAIGEFLIAVSVPDPAAQTWADAAYEIIEMALEDEGVGGKTSSGYGRMQPAPAN